jgi:hypothetical protein
MDVYLDGVLKKRVSLYRSTSLAQVVVYSAGFAVAGPHTLKVVVVGTSGHPRVDLDAFVVMQ